MKNFILLFVILSSINFTCRAQSRVAASSSGAAAAVPNETIRSDSTKLAQGPKIINIMPAFWQFEAEVDPSTSDSARVALFRKLVIMPYQNVYDFIVFKHDLSGKSILHYLKWLQPHLQRMRQLSGQIVAEVHPAIERFLNSFPDFEGKK